MITNARKNFILLNSNLDLPQLIKHQELTTTHKIVIPLQQRVMALISVKLFNFITLTFAETLSLSSVIHTVCTLWKCHGESREFLSRKFMKKLLICFGLTILHPILTKLQKKSIEYDCKTLSADHTYKFTKKLRTADSVLKTSKVYLSS